jgi:ribonuclease VapC
VIVDTSAIIAVLKQESDAHLFLDRLFQSGEVNRISAANYLEAAIVLDSARDALLSARLDELLADADIRIEPVTEAHARLARAAYRDFGKGSGHAAQLNYGDCFAYALARATGEAMLYKGDDFGQAGLRKA